MKLFFESTVALLLVASLVSAQPPGDLLPAPQLMNLFPLGGQAGATVEVTATGEHLDGAAALVFADPSITSEPRLDAQGTSLKHVFLIHLPANMKPGAYDARVRGRFGLSNPRRFCIGALPEITLTATNTSQDKAAVIDLDTVINSGTETGARCWFRFHAAAKQRVFIGVESPDTRLDPMLTVTDAEGRGLQRVIGTNGQTVSLEFTSPGEGDSFIELHDLLYRGGEDQRFRLIVSTQALPSQRADVMASCFMDDAELLHINALAIQDDDDVPHDLAITPPGEHVSVFPPGGRAATFTFSAERHEVFWVDVLSHRLGYATDPTLALEKIANRTTGESRASFITEAPDMVRTGSAAGFDLNLRDGALRFEAQQEGTYRVTLKDLFNTAPASPRWPYCLRIRPETPDFQLVAVPDQGPRNRPLPRSTHLLPPTLRRGGIASVRVFVQRQDGFAGDVSLSAEGLPDGVTCLGALLGNGDECAALTFYAADDAKSWAGFVRIIGQATINGRNVSRTARSGTAIWSVKDLRQEAFRARLTDGLGLAVVEEAAPLLIEAETNGVIEARATDKLTLKLNVTRRGGYDGAIKVRPFVLGDPDKSEKTEYSLGSDTSAIMELDLASLQARRGEHTFVLHGYAENIKYRKNVAENPAAESKEMTFVVFSKPIHIKINAEAE